MPAPKGNKFSKGRPKGSHNERTKQWEELGRMLLEDGAERVKTILQESDPENFMKWYNLLLEYFKPKLARSENENKNTGEVTIKVNYGRKPD